MSGERDEIEIPTDVYSAALKVWSSAVANERGTERNTRLEYAVIARWAIEAAARVAESHHNNFGDGAYALDIASAIRAIGRKG